MRTLRLISTRMTQRLGKRDLIRCPDSSEVYHPGNNRSIGEFADLDQAVSASIAAGADEAAARKISDLRTDICLDVAGEPDDGIWIERI